MAQRHDDQAREQRLREVVATYREPLLKYALRLTSGDAGRAEDAVQEAFLRAWNHVDRLTDDHGPVLGWLRRVVHNVVVDAYRTRQARPAEVEIENAETVAGPDPMDDVVNAMLVEQVLRGLWPEHRVALEQTYLYGRTAAEIGAALGVPAGTVKSRVHYAVRAAREAVAGRTPRAA